MGREIRRVPLDFDHPLNEVWPGFLMGPEFDWPRCPDCAGSGYGLEAQAIADTFYAHSIGGPRAGALKWCDKLGQAEVDNLLEQGRLQTRRDGMWHTDPLTAERVNEVNRTASLFAYYSHDAVNRMILIRFRCERLGIVLECRRCAGHGDIATTEQRAAADAWEATDPPTGGGWQLWETVSEGSPISPVFDAPEGLAAWMASPAYQWGAQGPWPYDEALEWITGVGWAPTLIARISR